MRNTILKSAVALALGLPLVASAESTFTTGAGTPITATARVDFTVVIPKFVSLQVGAAGAGINLITFDMTAAAASIGNAVAQAATAGSGDLANGVVTAKVLGNNGQVTLSVAAAAGGLVTATGDTIPFSQITTTTAVNTSATALPAPVLTNGTSAGVLAALTGTKITNQDAKWTYKYANAAVVAAGTYGGVNVLGGRVIYTASMP
jgi:hypothetical protein